MSNRITKKVNTMSYTPAELEEMIAEMIPLIAQHKADGAMSTAETCEKIKQVYENELHYVLTGEEITMPYEEWYE